jgi:hypothetical protein
MDGFEQAREGRRSALHGGHYIETISRHFDGGG